MADIPEKLITDIARRRAVIVVGSGASKHATSESGNISPDWEEFLKDANQKHPRGKCEVIDEAISKGDYLHACEWLKERYDYNWTKYLRDTFLAPKFRPGELHRLICELDCRILLSMNFDDILDRAAQIALEGTCIVKNYWDPDINESLRGETRYLIRAHGTLSTPDKLIFTQRDYAEARILYGRFYDTIDAALMTHTFVFIGAGHRDPDINLLLENHRFTFSEGHPHYFLTSNEIAPEMRRSLRSNRNLETVLYDKQDKQHSGLVEFLSEILFQVEGERERIGKEIDW